MSRGPAPPLTVLSWDLSTGQVLVEDAERSYRDNLWQVLTGRAYRQAKEIADGGPANTGAGEG